MLDGMKQKVLQRLDRRIDHALRHVDARVTHLEGREGGPAGPHALDRDTVDAVHFLFGRGGVGSRTLSNPTRRNLTKQIQTLTGQQRIDPLLRQAYWSLLELEARGAGRIAGSTQNILGKLVTTPLLQPPPGPLLEIGSLFGLFAAGLVRQFATMGDQRVLTVIDPLVGHQVQAGSAGALDMTSTPVIRAVLESNLALAGLDRDVRVLEGLSTDDQIRRDAAATPYAVVVIDGDHSAKGVVTDLEWVETVVVPGAIVVIDDFGGPRWPGVKIGTERYLAGDHRLQMVGTVATSAFLRFGAPA